MGWAGDGKLCGPDRDLDAWPDMDLGCQDKKCKRDNCPDTPNSGQEDADNDGVISLVGFECDLLLWLHLLRLHLLDLTGENCFGLGCRVDAVGLNGDDEVTAVLQKV